MFLQNNFKKMTSDNEIELKKIFLNVCLEIQFFEKKKKSLKLLLCEITNILRIFIKLNLKENLHVIYN